MTHPIKTIIWKELRECFKWATLAALVLTLAEAYALYLQRDRMSSVENCVTLFAPDFQLVALLGCALVGAGLGALQILPELRRDQWAALLHRPAPRSAIFLGKVAAGLLLYLWAAGLPFALSVIYVATPGTFPAPFVPGMVWPAASIVAFGIAFYAVGILVSLTHGRWYGRRAVLGLSVVPLFILHSYTHWLFLPPLVMAAIVLLAAGGVMAGNGSVSHRSRAAQVAFAFVIFLGVDGGLFLLVLGLGLLPGAGPEEPAGFEFREFVIDKQGKVLLYSFGSESSPGAKLLNLDGTPAAGEENLDNGMGDFPTQLRGLCWTVESPQPDYATTWDPWSLKKYLDVVHGDNSEGSEFWYYLAGKDYFVGYDKSSHRPVGICDRNGYHPAGTTPAPFPTALQSKFSNYVLPVLFWEGSQLYGMDFGDRSMLPLFTAPSGNIVSGTVLTIGTRPVYIAVALEYGVQILDLHGQPVVKIPFSHDVETWTSLSGATALAGDRIFIGYDPESRLSLEGRPPIPSFVDEFDLQGKLLHSYSAVVNRSVALQPGWASRAGLGALPLLPTALYNLAYAGSPEEPRSMLDMYAIEYGLRLSPSKLALLGAFSLAAAACAVWWSCRAGFSRRETVWWTAFVFCFSLPGLIAFRLAAHWPTRISCPQCSHQRSLQAEECPSCHQAWPVPASNGTEILVAH